MSVSCKILFNNCCFLFYFSVSSCDDKKEIKSNFSSRPYPKSRHAYNLDRIFKLTFYLSKLAITN